MPGHARPIPTPTYGIEDSVCEISTDLGSTWLKIPGVESYEESGGEAVARAGVNAEGAWARVGLPGLPQIALPTQYAPLHPVWEDIHEAFYEGTVVRLRETLAGETLFEAETALSPVNTVAITTNGVASFAGERPDFEYGPFEAGMYLIVGSDVYKIATIDPSGVTATVTPEPSTAVSATDVYSIELPFVRRHSYAKIVMTDRSTIASEGNLMAGLTLQLISRFSPWQRQA